MLVCDIESAPQARSLLAPFPRESEEFVEKEHGSLKDPVKIAEWKAKQREAWTAQWLSERAGWRETLVKQASLSPRLGRVVAIGLRNDPGTGTLNECRVELDESKERDLLRWLGEVLDRCIYPDVLVTFNGSGFDLPFLNVRAAVNGMRVPFAPKSGWLARYRSEPHADLRMILTNWDNRTEGTLVEWCQAFGIDTGDDGPTGGDIFAMVEAGDVEGIRRKCSEDVELTYTLATAVQAAGLF